VISGLAKEDFRMKRRTWVALTVLVILLVILSCAKAYHPYVPTSQVPRIVYINGDVENLRSVAGKLLGKPVYIEVTTPEGVAETGKLISIGEDDLVMSPGYYFSTEGESAGKVDIEKIIPKKDIIILKVF
jgi:hypothetical protein